MWCAEAHPAGDTPNRYSPTALGYHSSMSQVLFDYTKQDASGASCTAHAWAKVPEPLNARQRGDWKARAADLLKKHHAVLVAHYYVDGDIQDLALEPGGCVADSL